MRVGAELPEVWQTAPPELCLGPDDVHVWSAALDLPAEVLGQLVATLSPDERLRARSLTDADDQRRFLVGRGILRSILSRYTKTDPAAIDLAYGTNGKPYLAGSDAQLSFSMSRSGRVALFAVARSLRLGIDVERFRAVPELGEIIVRYLSLDEQSYFESLDEERRLEAFFAFWTELEAIAKATGEGVGNALDAPRKRRGPWTIQRLEPATGYVATLAVRAPAFGVACWSVCGTQAIVQSRSASG